MAASPAPSRDDEKERVRTSSSLDSDEEEERVRARTFLRRVKAEEREVERNTPRVMAPGRISPAEDEDEENARRMEAEHLLPALHSQVLRAS